MITEFNGITGETTTRELTANELKERKATANAELEQLASVEQLRQSAISKLVAGQPLTTAEAELLVIR